MLILESLEVKMVRDKDSEIVADLESFTWDMISFDKDFIKLQIKWVNPQNIGTFASSDYITVTFWDVDYFKSVSGFEVEFGTTLVQQVYR